MEARAQQGQGAGKGNEAAANDDVVYGAAADSPANGGTGTSQDDAFEILSDDNLDDNRSDTFSPPIDEVLAAADSDVGIGGDDVDAHSGVGGNGNAMKPSVTGGADPDNESPSNQQRRTRSLGCSPEPFPVSLEAPPTKQAQPDPADYAAGEPGQAPASDNTLCDTTVLETTGASLAEDRAERHRHGLKHDLQPSAEICGKTSDPAGTIRLYNDEWDKRHNPK
ncbi:hypothetical protein DL766_007520 [Monosporascus sp. MC13-8B]|uniref:Uncharacterized protein n=1 Tax=Monosporascus cannonballus TaxID=155416 RepID=A0ABY0H4U5_9PEZI|nr:hypothetical protein DL763_008126 [Monosporascus cannonballus]RYO84836.1 hypothetical protein DL762_005458 [Monosporascus cannonballus]RYP23367.1 hypothetical protein DL766_007520 [Monosporascus sp. MC13-8B]